MWANAKKCLWLVILLLNGCTSEMDLSQAKRPVLTVAGIVHICPENKIALIERAKEPFGLAKFGGHVETESKNFDDQQALLDELNISD